MKIMKVFPFLIALFVLAIYHFSDKTISTRPKKNTTLQVFNPTKDTITVYLTLNANDSNWVTNVNGIFGIKSSNNLQGFFVLLPNKKVSYTSKKPIGGNISFNNPPLNCPFPAPTLYEFTLNNYGTVDKAQETVDISCVYGVTTIGKFTLFNGGYWNSGQNDTIKTIQNKTMRNNTGISGVYPYGCTTCTGSSGMVNCGNKVPYDQPNTKPICNVQRPSKNNGGIVLITYLETLK